MFYSYPNDRAVYYKLSVLNQDNTVFPGSVAGVDQNGHVPMTHAFVEKLIGSIRRELLDHSFFCTAPYLNSVKRSMKLPGNKTHNGGHSICP
jgi:hypothetical protein